MGVWNGMSGSRDDEYLDWLEKKMRGQDDMTIGRDE